MGIIYFIQPAELVGTNRYKIGCSKSDTLKRCTDGYRKGSRYICIMECNSPLVLEKNIKDEFNKLFKLIAGTEYFEGDEAMMIKTFLKIVGENIANTSFHLCGQSINEEDINSEISETSTHDSDDEITYNICTFEDYLLSSSIEKIVITNKKSKYGYLKFDNKCAQWHKIYDDEPLLLWLENNTQYDVAIDKTTNKLVRVDKNKLDHAKNYNDIYNSVNIEFNFDKIIIDICKKCYNKNPEFYILKNHEYFVRCSGTDFCNNYCILDTKNLTITDYDNKINDGILIDINFNPFGFYFNNFEDVNIDIVNDIINSLIIDKDILIKYKKLCYNILVEQKEEIIFYDCTDKYPLLSEWLGDIIYLLSSNYGYYYDITENNIKNIKNKNPKVVYVNNNFVGAKQMTKKQVQKAINEVINLGIKNIIVKDRTKNMYDHKAYIEYIINNKENILNNAFNKGIMSSMLPRDIDKETRIGNYDTIFSHRDLLFTNYLKWCCTI